MTLQRARWKRAYYFPGTKSSVVIGCLWRAPLQPLGKILRHSWWIHGGLWRPLGLDGRAGVRAFSGKRAIKRFFSSMFCVCVAWCVYTGQLLDGVASPFQSFWATFVVRKWAPRLCVEIKRRRFLDSLFRIPRSASSSRLFCQVALVFCPFLATLGMHKWALWWACARVRPPENVFGLFKRVCWQQRTRSWLLIVIKIERCLPGCHLPKFL